MKYIINEAQLKKLISEVTKIDLTKDDIKKYCKTSKVPKELIDKSIINYQADVKKYLESTKNNYLSEYPVVTTFINVKSLFNLITTNIITIGTNIIYSNFGYITYDSKKDKENLILSIYNELNESLIGNFVKKRLLKTFVTKNNVESVKNSTGEILTILNNSFPMALNSYVYTYINKIKYEYSKIAPICKDAIVIKDFRDEYNFLPIQKQYNPKLPPYEVETPYTDVGNIINTYIEKINATLDSLA